MNVQIMIVYVCYIPNAKHNKYKSLSQVIYYEYQ